MREQSEEISCLRARIDAQEAELRARATAQPTKPRQTSIPSTNSLDTTGPVLAQIRPMKSVSPEEISASSTAGESETPPLAEHPSQPPQPTQHDAPTTSAPTGARPEFNPEQIGSFIKDIGRQYKEYTQEGSSVDEAKKQTDQHSQSPFMEGLKHYNDADEQLTGEVSGKPNENAKADRFLSRPDVVGPSNEELGNITQEVKHGYEEQSGGMSTIPIPRYDEGRSGWLIFIRIRQ